MSEELIKILENLEDFMRDNDLTFVATAGEIDRVCISHYNGVSFEDVQFDAEISAHDLKCRIKDLTTEQGD